MQESPSLTGEACADWVKIRRKMTIMRRGKEQRRLKGTAIVLRFERGIGIQRGRIKLVSEKGGREPLDPPTKFSLHFRGLFLISEVRL